MGDVAGQSSSVFVYRALQKIVADTNKKSAFAALRTACEEAMGMCANM